MKFLWSVYTDTQVPGDIAPATRDAIVALHNKQVAEMAKTIQDLVNQLEIVLPKVGRVNDERMALISAADILHSPASH